MTQIFTIVDEKYKGDEAAARAVSAAFHDILEQQPEDSDIVSSTPVNIGDIERLPNLIKDLDAGEKAYIIFASSSGDNLKALSAIQGENVIKILSSHQLSDKVLSAAAEFNYVALPKHALSDEQRIELSSKTKLIETLGVPHMVTIETLEEAFFKRLDTDQRFADMLALPSTAIDLLVLSGDAPDTADKMYYFSPEEAAAVALRAMKASKELGGILAITNGPRTGKFNQGTTEFNHGRSRPDLKGTETQNHRGDTELDPVTAAARQILLDDGFVENNDFFIWDFRHAIKQLDPVSGKEIVIQEADSAYQALLAATIRTDGEVYMPGETISMVKEAADTLGRQFTIYEAGSMSETHYAHMHVVNAAGLAGILTMNGTTIPAAKQNAPVEFITDAQRIARAVLAPR